MVELQVESETGEHQHTSGGQSGRESEISLIQHFLLSLEFQCIERPTHMAEGNPLYSVY